MKLLFDQNISFRIEKKLSNIFQNCAHVSSLGLLNFEDLQIWEFAKKNNFSIVTFDSDFFDFSIINGHPPKIVWLRCVNLSTNEIASFLFQNQDIINDFLMSNDFSEVACLELKQF